MWSPMNNSAPLKATDLLYPSTKYHNNPENNPYIAAPLSACDLFKRLLTEGTCSTDRLVRANFACKQKLVVDGKSTTEGSFGFELFKTEKLYYENMQKIVEEDEIWNGGLREEDRKKWQMLNNK